MTNMFRICYNTSQNDSKTKEVMMKLIIGYINPFKLDDVVEAVKEAGVSGFLVDCAEDVLDECSRCPTRSSAGCHDNSFP